MASQVKDGVSALRILDGGRRSGEPKDLGNIGICHCGRDKGTLYVLANAQGQRYREMEEKIVRTIIDYFQRSPNSVTHAVTGAIRAANKVVYQDNLRSFGPERTLAGVYCAVVRPGYDLLLAYAGPAIALLVESEGIVRMYSEYDNPRLREDGQDHILENELGRSEDIHATFYSSPVAPGDVFALATPSLLECGLDDEELANALTEAGAEGLPDDRDMTVLVVTYPQAGSEAERAGRTAAEREASPGRGEKLAASAHAALGKLAGMFSARPHAAPGKAAPDAVPAAAAAPAAAAQEPEAEIPTWLNREARQSRRRARDLGRGLKLPTLPRPALSWKLIAAVLGVAVLAALAIWWGRYSAAQAKEHKFQTLVGQAEATRSLGQASLDRSQALTYLKSADALITQALAVKPDAPAALALRDSIVRDMDEAKGILRLTGADVTTLYTFTSAGASPSRIVGDGFNLYVLDKGDQKVHKFVLNAQGNGMQPGGDSVLVRKGDQIGGKVVGDLVDIVWLSAGGNRKTANLGILESGGSLIQYDVTKGLSVLTVTNPAVWRKVQATGGYSGNFYVLDPVANTILRYHPTTRGYEEAPSAYLQTKVELASAQDMAIDGDIFVLMVNGQVLWLSSGRPQAFPVEGLERPMSAPLAIFTNEGSQSVYVTDPANARVVKISKQGVVQKVLVYEEGDATFQRLRGVFADEKKLALYVTSGTKLLMFAIPK